MEEIASPQVIQPSTKRMPELDGLRGIAILMVFLLHYIAESHTHDGNFGPLYRFAQIFRLGWSGVDLFFVLSGFLIGGILLDSRSSAHYFKPFYTRRLHRIAPVYYAWISVFGVVGFVVSKWGPSYVAELGTASVPVWVYYPFLQNLMFKSLSEFTRYWMGPTWSLAVEEQFYLVSPWLIRFLSLRRLTQFLIACVIGAPVLRYVLYPHSPGILGMYYVLTPCRADALALGMLAAVAWRTRARAWLAQHISYVKVASGVLLLGALAMVKWMPAPGNAIEAAMQYSWLAGCLVRVPDGSRSAPSAWRIRAVAALAIPA
jgi:peptidoglycan/LPS O-acetylase OafA/YrhL